MNKKKQIAGFTLVETMMYVFLWGGVILVLLNVGLFLSTASMETVQRSLLTSESSNVANRLFRDVKSATSFVEAQSNLGQALSQLVMTNQDLDQIGFRVNAGYLQKGVNGNYYNLHSEDIIVDEFLVEEINDAYNGNLFKFTIVFRNIYDDEFLVTRSVNFIYD